jgi:hypothetical protein
LADTIDAKSWLETLARMYFNGIMTTILLIQVRIQKKAPKEKIENQKLSG